MKLNPYINQISNTGRTYRVVEVFKSYTNYAVKIRYEDGTTKQFILNKENKPVREL